MSHSDNETSAMSHSGSCGGTHWTTTPSYVAENP